MPSAKSVAVRQSVNTGGERPNAKSVAGLPYVSADYPDKILKCI